MPDNRLSLIDEKVRCSCNGYNLDKLIQPRILVLLSKHHKQLHGYRIIELLNDKSFFNEPIDSTGIYRTLNLMETKKLLSSEWEINAAGPAKKVYQITEDGESCLINWIGTLEKYQESITQILEIHEA